MRDYAAEYARRGLPLFVTETGRETALLKREFAAGAKFLGAYNQVAGTNFGYTQSVNNWGDPVSAIVTDYDFDSMIDPLGRMTHEADEARLFAAFLRALGEKAALAALCDDVYTIDADFPMPDRVNVLALPQGKLLMVANLGDAAGTARIQEIGVTVTVPASGACLLPVGVPFDGGVIESTDCEIYSLSPLVLYGIDPHAVLTIGGETFRVDRSGTYGGVPVRLCTREEIAAYDLRKTDWVYTDSVKTHPVETVSAGGFCFPSAGRPVTDCGLERNGVYAGGAVYTFETDARDVLFYRAADFLSVYDGGKFLSTRFASGKSYRYTFESKSVTVRSEKWGNCNFDDPREKNLYIRSDKGVRGFYDVLSHQPLGNFRLSYAKEFAPGKPYDAQPCALDPYADLNWYNTARMPFVCLYYKTVCVTGEAVFLQLENGTAEAAAYVDGAYVGQFHPADRLLDLTPFVKGKRQVTLGLLVRKRIFSERVGEAVLLQCRPITVHMAPFTERDMERVAAVGSVPACLPLAIPAGACRVVEIDMTDRPDCYGVVAGSDFKLTAIYGGRVIARMIAPDWPGVKLRGGKAERFYIPSCWAGADKTLKLVVESIGQKTEFDFSIHY